MVYIEFKSISLVFYEIDLPEGIDPPFYMNDRKYTSPLFPGIFYSVLNDSNSYRLQGGASIPP